jgi:hypothetical protein
MLLDGMLGGVRKPIVEGHMRIRRFVSGVLFVLGVYFFGVYLTAAEGGATLTDHLLFVLFGSNNNAQIDCSDGSVPLPCNPGVLKTPNGGVEIVDLSTDPPTFRKSIDLGASNPTSIAVMPDGRRFYFVDALNSNVYLVDSATGAFLNTTPIPEGPLDCVLSPDAKYLYVTTQEPSVVTVETINGTTVGKVAPGQSYPEQFGGIALNPSASGTHQLAVAATSSAPAYYLFGAKNANVTLGPRTEVSGYCTDPDCGRSDDVVFAGPGRVLLANLRCSQLYSFALPSGEQISGGTFSSRACLPLNPQNSALYSPISQAAYLVYRRFSFGLYPGMAVVDPEDFSSFMISGIGGIPEAAAFAPGGRFLYIISQETFTSPFVLRLFDVATGSSTSARYQFATFTFDRTAIDAKIVQAPGVFLFLAGGLPFVGGKGLAASLGQVALMLFGLALLRFDRKR